MNKIINFKKQSFRLGIGIEEIILIETVLKEYGGKLFLVGGNVRDLILKNTDTSRSDLVCNLPINLIIRALTKKKIKISKVGIEYGSIIASVNKFSFDITSMRSDIETDGRYAKIKFTNDLREDAKRRDFTINSIYCDVEGNLIDPFNGIKDLREKKVKFIGNPEDRINEDYLRILRFLRFSLLYSKKFDFNGFSACKKLQKNLIKLSLERRINEIKKILILENVENNFILKKLISFIKFALDSEINVHNFKKLCVLEKKLGRVSKTRRIKFLTRNAKKEPKFLGKLSKSSRQRINYEFNFKKNTDYKITKQILEKTEEQIYDNIIINYADGLINYKRVNSLDQLIVQLKKRPFPIRGSDLLKIGYKKGKKMGKILSDIEEWWIKNNFLPNKNMCLSYAKKKLPSG